MGVVDVSAGNASTVRLLVTVGADVEKKNALGFTAEMLAKECRHADVTRVLTNRQ